MNQKIIVPPCRLPRTPARRTSPSAVECLARLARKGVNFGFWRQDSQAEASLEQEVIRLRGPSSRGINRVRGEDCRKVSSSHGSLLPAKLLFESAVCLGTHRCVDPCGVMDVVFFRTSTARFGGLFAGTRVAPAGACVFVRLPRGAGERLNLPEVNVSLS